jgi:hypothetical protein
LFARFPSRSLPGQFFVERHQLVVATDRFEQVPLDAGEVASRDVGLEL